MNEIVQAIEDLLLYAETNLGLTFEDKIYARNQLLELLQTEPEDATGTERPLEEITRVLVDYAVENDIAEEGAEIRFETKLLGLVTPAPSAVINEFFRKKKTEGTYKAVQYFYDLSIKNNYIRLNDIRKNICWYADGDKGQIAITVNLSKPEKDPKQVLAEKAFKGKKYPKCLLCLENIGFCGTPAHPARQTLRCIPLKLRGEGWHMQYSPYMYYDEHCIVFNDKHVPMKITEETPKRLLEFTDFIPYYFLGSNADLPIVGGSILAHDHYQGGRKVLPMFFTKMRKVYETKDEVTVAVRDWYNSVVTIYGPNRFLVAKKAGEFIKAWETYSDESANIIAQTTERHNTVTPVASKEKGIYYMDLILRNNRTDEEHPFGIFHPTKDMHNIKKESIGLIEAMGLFILPGRLKWELLDLMIELKKEKPDLEMISNDERLSKHFTMFVQAMADYGTGLTMDKAREAILAKVNDVCFRILECTAVFKNTYDGQLAFDRFMRTVCPEPVHKKPGRPPKKKPGEEGETSDETANAEPGEAKEPAETPDKTEKTDK